SPQTLKLLVSFKPGTSLLYKPLQSQIWIHEGEPKKKNLSQSQQLHALFLPLLEIWPQNPPTVAAHPFFSPPLHNHTKPLFPHQQTRTLFFPAHLHTSCPSTMQASTSHPFSLLKSTANANYQQPSVPLEIA